MVCELHRPCCDYRELSGNECWNEVLALTQKRKHPAPETVSSHLGTRKGASFQLKRDGKTSGLLDILEALGQVLSKSALSLDFFQLCGLISNLYCIIYFQLEYNMDVFLSVKACCQKVSTIRMLSVLSNVTPFWQGHGRSSNRILYWENISRYCRKIQKLVQGFQSGIFPRISLLP